VPREEAAQALGDGRRILDHQEVPRVRHDEALRLREPRLDEPASFHEARRALLSRHVEDGLRDALGLAGPEAPGVVRGPARAWLTQVRQSELLDA
jgi:hypothetical protein